MDPRPAAIHGRLEGTLSANRTAASVLGAAVGAALLALAPALVAGAAFAATGPAVEFSGGSVLNAVVCKSAPNTAKLTVPAESRVMFVNRLGQTATLRVDGRAVGQVKANQAVPVTFHYGPVSVSMAFPCSVGVVEEFESVSVAVTPRSVPAAAAASGAAAGASTGGRAQSGASRPNGSGQTVAPETPAATDPWAPQATTAPLPAAVPSNDRPADEAVAVDLPVPASGTPVNGPSGLLALVATVLSIGVGVAAIRAVMARRTAMRFA